MNLSLVPIDKYIEEIKKDARKDGFLWIMILVAREKDFVDHPEIYEDWNSINNITDKTILFLFPGNDGDKLAINYNNGDADVCDGLSIRRPSRNKHYSALTHINKDDHLLKEKIANNQTDSANKLKSLFKLKERDIPCLVMISTMPDGFVEDDRSIFALENVSVYDKVKNIVSLTEELIEKYPYVLDKDFIEGYLENDRDLINFYLEVKCILREEKQKKQSIRINDSFLMAESIIAEFRDWVENGRGCTVISDSNEKKVQTFLLLIAKHMCDENNWDLSSEPDGGRGPVDFKISRGNDKTIIEIKLSSNPQCAHGLEKQIEEYAKAERTNKKIFLIINNGKHYRRLQGVEELREIMVKNGKNPAQIEVIDAFTKPSASVLR
jgi:hypothetical protein